ncbi:hypothetical protein Taro_010770 [Colocasia esculenta]|uniref:Enhancer of mRNA-decapping protein 4 n=1 Tax=Colocasia esculenta TaxID=4460 RepID=A0A843U4H6_COLES|nr:hypothetical protein [Colocasia esculenta]
MASAGNPNQAGHFDVHKLFKPPQNPSPVPGGNPPGHSPFSPPASYAAAATPATYPAAPPGLYSYPPQTAPPFHHYHHPFLHYPQDQLGPLPALPYPSPIANPGQAAAATNPGARLMALLGTHPPAPLEPAVSMPPPSSLPSASSGEFSLPPPNAPVLSTIPSAPPMITPGAPPPVPARLPSGKQPRGLHLGGGDCVVYDVDARESQPPQLEVTPITKYSSDPELVLGRQIAVNRTYICYGLRQGTIRVLNINTALRSLFRGHTKRVTDMAFFADDVHLLASASSDGRIFVWKIYEGPDKEDKPQITGKIIVAIQMMSDGKSFHPRVCWHCHKQEVLVVGVGNCLLRIDTNKVGKGEIFSEEEPLKCPIDRPIDGVQLIGKHDGEVTDLTMSQWMTSRLASASEDGMVKIWEDRKVMPLVTLRPHDGQPVNSVSFLTAPHRPDHIVLITAGPLNREVKIWACASEEGWLLHNDSKSWQCTQTLELRSSSESRLEDAFFNQIVLLPQASLMLLANAKKNTIYAVHIDYGQNPASTLMDYVTEFTVTMPILSLTGTSDCYADDEHVVQVYCVQTQAIQQYALYLSQCLPPPLESASVDKDLSISRASDALSSDGSAIPELSGITVSEVPAIHASQKLSTPHVFSEDMIKVRYPVISSSPDISSVHEVAAFSAENRPSAPPLSDTDIHVGPISPSPISTASNLSAIIGCLRSSSKSFEQESSPDHAVEASVADLLVDSGSEGVITNIPIVTNLPDISSLDENSTKGGSKSGPADITMMLNPSAYKMGAKATHLITPSEILSRPVSTEVTQVIPDLGGAETRSTEMAYNTATECVEVQVKIVSESKMMVHEEPHSRNKPAALTTAEKEKSSSSLTEESTVVVAKECSASGMGILSEEASPVEDVAPSETLEQPSNSGGQAQDAIKDVPESHTMMIASESGVTVIAESATMTMVTQSPSAVKGKKPKAKQFQASGSSSSFQSPFNSIDSLNEQGVDLSLPIEAGFSQTLVSIQEALNQVATTQKNMQKQMNETMTLPVTKEGRRMEAALGRHIEKTIKANNDALWARFQEEMAKHEKSERDKIQQITTLISNSLSKELSAIIEKVLKKENSALGSALMRLMNPAVEKAISSAITDSFQQGIGDKAVNQLERHVNAKLESVVARQIQAQFQTSGKQALQVQDGLKCNLEASVIPSFEKSCKSMFEQIDAAFHKGMVEYTASVQQQFESMHTPLALALRDAISSASTITQTLNNELAEGQQKLLSLVSSGNSSLLDSLARQQSNGAVSGLHETVEAPFDPKKELTRLISDHKFDEAFTLALQRSDVSIVSWLCSQVDLEGICLRQPLPLSQGVLLSLFQQLACDLGKETSQKLGWMTQVAMAINPADPMTSMHVRPIFDQVYQMLALQRSLPTTAPGDSSRINLIMHVINSVLTTFK